MFELEHHGYYPLTREQIDLAVPARPGEYTLAVRLSNGVHQTFFSSQRENLYRSLRTPIKRDSSHFPAEVLEHLERYQCCFTCFINLRPEDRIEVEKMLCQTFDPVVRLRIIDCN